jgi:hypothetical protein
MAYGFSSTAVTSASVASGMEKLRSRYISSNLLPLTASNSFL